jgi:hypothetical protein
LSSVEEQSDQPFLPPKPILPLTMKLSAIFSQSLVLAAIVTPLHAWDCFATGYAQDPELAMYHAERACSGWNGNKGSFQGIFKPREKKTTCVNILEGQANIKMEVENPNDKVSLDLKDSDCVKDFFALINACDYTSVSGGLRTKGGKGKSSGGWFFR